MFRKKLKLYQIILSDGVPLKKNIYEYEINYLCMIAIYFVVAKMFMQRILNLDFFPSHCMSVSHSVLLGYAWMPDRYPEEGYLDDNGYPADDAYPEDDGYSPD